MLSAKEIHKQMKNSLININNAIPVTKLLHQGPIEKVGPKNSMLTIWEMHILDLVLKQHDGSVVIFSAFLFLDPENYWEIFFTSTVFVASAADTRWAKAL